MANSAFSRQIVSALGANVGPYVFGNEINWDYITKTYGEEFRNGYLASANGISEFNDEGYYPSEPFWFICSPQVTEPGEAIVKSLLQEIDNGTFSLYGEDVTRHNMFFYLQELSVGTYLDSAKFETLWRNGLIMCVRRLVHLDHRSVSDNLSEYVTDDMLGESVNTFHTTNEYLKEDEEDGSDQIWEEYCERRGWT